VGSDARAHLIRCVFASRRPLFAAADLTPRWTPTTRVSLGAVRSHDRAGVVVVAGEAVVADLPERRAEIWRPTVVW